MTSLAADIAGGAIGASSAPVTRRTERRLRGVVLLGACLVASGLSAGLWTLGTLTAVETLRPAAVEKIRLRLPVTALSLHRSPSRPDRFERLPQIAAGGAGGLTADGILDAHRRSFAAAMSGRLGAALGEAAAGALAMVGVVGSEYAAYRERAAERAPVATAAADVEAAGDGAQAEAPPLPSARPATLARSPDRQREQTRLARIALPAEERSPAETRSPAPKAPPVTEPAALRRSGVAVYDLSAGLVYMPSGERLEAHSGIGPMRDNPRFVHVKMRGATPPATYRLSLRERLFHGVQAIRLTPVDGKPPKGRVGLLAHTYMLRVPGDSNGCVVFRHYDRFLAAFRRGEIRQMVVVPSATAARAQQMASLSGGEG